MFRMNQLVIGLIISRWTASVQKDIIIGFTVSRCRSTQQILKERSVPDLSSIVGTGERVSVFSITSCVTEVRHLRFRGFGKCGDFLAQNYESEQSAN